MVYTRKRKRAPSSLAKQIGGKAREARLAAGLTQEDVAERVRLATEVYGRLERGRMLPSVPTLYRICHALGISSDEILGLMDSEGKAAPRLTLDLPKGADNPLVARIIRKLRRMDPARLKFVGQMTSHLAALPGVPERTSRATTPTRRERTAR